MLHTMRNLGERLMTSFAKTFRVAEYWNLYHGLCLETNLEIGMVKHVSNPTLRLQTWRTEHMNIFAKYCVITLKVQVTKKHQTSLHL